MQRVLFAGAALAALAALVGQATAAQTARTIDVRLPKHVFRQFRAPDGEVVNAKWGKGPGQVALVHDSYGPTGGSSFDVVDDVVCILDQHNGRVLAYTAGKAPRAIPLTVPGAAGAVFRAVDSSLAVAKDGTIYVLEPASSMGRPTLRAFAAHGGMPIATTTQGGALLVRTAGKTAYVGNSIGGPWQQVMRAGRVARAHATPYRTFTDSSRVQVHPLKKPYNKPQPWVVSMTTTSGKQLTWSVSSPDSIQVEDAESFGGIELVLALNVYTDKRNEYEVLILGSHGLLDSFSVPYDRYTETSLNDDFRIDGATVYHRGSTARGLYVDYYSF